jgi:hypothetical protein
MCSSATDQRRSGPEGLSIAPKAVKKIMQLQAGDFTERTRESSEEYEGVIFRSGPFRVARDRDNQQWLFQRCRSGLRGGKPKWDNIGYCRTREALINLFRKHCGMVPPELEVMPNSLKRGLCLSSDG